MALSERDFQTTINRANECIVALKSSADRIEELLEKEHGPLPTITYMAQNDAETEKRQRALDEVASAIYLKGISAHALSALLPPPQRREYSEMAACSLSVGARYSYAIGWNPINQEFWLPAEASRRSLREFDLVPRENCLLLADIIPKGRYRTQILIDDSERSLLSHGAFTLGDLSDKTNGKALSLAKDGDLTNAKKTLHSGIAEAIQYVKNVEQSFLKYSADLKPALKNLRFNPLPVPEDAAASAKSEAASILFASLKNEFLKEDEAMTVGKGSFDDARIDTSILFQHCIHALTSVMESRSLTFALDVSSTPAGGVIGYHRFAETYGPYQNATNATIPNLAYAVWTIKVSKTGFCDQEKEHNPIREFNHVVHFDLVECK
jgi:hypothetical protein